MTIQRHEQSPTLSKAVQYGDTVYLAGITARDLDKDIKGQAQEVLTEIDRLLAKCGSNKAKILTAQIWVTDIRNRPLFNDVWMGWVDKTNMPARACVEAKLAEAKALIEIMVVAAR